MQAFGTNADELEDAIEAAFLAIAQVHRLMSFHDPESEVSLMNGDSYCKAVRSFMDMARLEIGAGIFAQHGRDFRHHNSRATGEMELSSEERYAFW